MRNEKSGDTEKTDPWKPHETSFKQCDQKLPLFPSNHAVKATIPSFQILFFIFESLAHIGELLPTARLLPVDEFAEYERHARVEIRLPQLE